MHPPTARGGFLVSDLRRFVSVTLVSVEAEVRNGRHSKPQHQREFNLEGQPASHLYDALRARRRGDLAKVGRRRSRAWGCRYSTCCGVRETHEVLEVRGLAAELEGNSMLEGNGFVEP